MGSDGSAGGEFPSTHWSWIALARDRESDRGLRALGELLTRYRPALVAYGVGRFGVSEDEAGDLFQSFVLDAVLRRDLIGRAQPLEGHQFRSYLLNAWHKHIQGEYRSQRRAKRYPAGGLTSLSELKEVEAGGEVEPSPALFDVKWGLEVIARAVDAMRAECLGRGKEDVWKVFEGRILKPLTEGASPTPYEELVTSMGLSSPIQAYELLKSAKTTFTWCLREVVGAYTVRRSDIDAEIRELHAILSRTSL